jgi:hypothetical protein
VVGGGGQEMDITNVQYNSHFHIALERVTK